MTNTRGFTPYHNVSLVRVRIHKKAQNDIPQCPNRKVVGTGFTIVEMLLYMGLLSGFLVILTSIFLSALDVSSESQTFSRMEEDGRYILARLTYDIARSQAVTIPTTLGTPANSLQLTIGGESVIYGISGTNLTIASGSETNILNSFGSYVSGFTVVRLGNPGGKESVTVDVTLTSATQRPSGPEVRSFHMTQGVR
ncbi:hypothetical protein HYV22_02430 [Candidatus Gottesmanbacteria bacterium]|nr:hypothetical protein [Candidatus Gottesmanbacteria bacterium]